MLNPRPGGNYEITFSNSDGSEFTCHGRYIEVELLKKLSLTWEWKNEPGVESMVTVIFIPEQANTRMRFEHARVGEKSAHNYLVGWKSTFGKLERLVVNLPS
jgi:uncharacterized protein YndB with AHSA1/START domain